MSLAQLHGTLLAEWKKPQRNPSTIDQILKQISDQFYSGAVQGLDEDAQTTIYKDLYEIGALNAILRADMNAFEDSILQALSFYEIKPKADEHKYLMIGLNLMYLLANGKRLSDFHMLLEQIPQNIQSSNPYIATPVRLEQSLMEGAYNKVVLTEKTIPSPFYAVFIRIMMDAVRSNIALSIEKSFKELNVKDSCTMLLFENETQTVEFARQRGWKVDGSSFIFSDGVVAAEKPSSLDTQRIAKQIIFYAKQLEMIV